MSGTTLLLLGQEAEALAPRLEASGYSCWVGIEQISNGCELVVLGMDAADQLPVLREQLGAVPVLLDIGDDSVAARSRMLRSGATDFWLSSAGASDLLMRLRLHLGQQLGRSAPLTVLQVADLVVTPARRHVQRGGRAIALTAREYQLLVYLIERAGQVLSREAILAGIWSDQQGVASNVIEVYVRYLRQKLEAGGERRLIHTVRGRGYCLAAKP